jgi:hypothetical protein
MSDTREASRQPAGPRRRFLGLLGMLPLGWAGLGALGLGRDPQRPPDAGERPLREADFYRPHDLAG